MSQLTDTASRLRMEAAALVRIAERLENEHVDNMRLLEPDNPQANAILKLVSDSLGVEAWRVLGDSRPADVSFARKVTYMALSDSGMALSSIGRFCGGRSHGTIVHGIRSLQNEMDTCQKVKAEVLRIIELVNKLPTNEPEQAPAPLPRAS